MAGISGEKEADSSIGKLCEILSKIMEQSKVVSEVAKSYKVIGTGKLFKLGSTCSINFELSWI